MATVSSNPLDQSISVATTINQFTNSEIVRKEKTNLETVKKLFHSCRGMLLGFIASALTSSCFFIIKILQTQGSSVLGPTVIFDLGVFIPSVCFILFNECGPGWQKRSRVLKGVFHNPFHNKTLVLLITLGLAQVSSILLRAISLIYLSVGDMSVLVFSSPIVTTILAHFILGEPCGKLFILIAIFTLCGVGLITKPPLLTGAKDFDTTALIGSGIALSAMFLLSLTWVAARGLKEQNILDYTFFTGLVGTVVTLPIFLIFEPLDSLFPTDSSTGLYLRIGLFSISFIAIASINLSLKLESAGVIALVRSCDVIFAFLFQFIFLSVVPDLLSGIGAIIVWTGVIVAGTMKYWNERKLKTQEQNL